MKWIVYALLAMNVGYFASQMFFAEQPNTQASVTVQADINANALVRQVTQLPQALPVPSAAPLQIEAAPEAAQCVFLSRVAGAPNELRSWLAEQGIAAEFIEVESVIGTDFLVVMPPMESYQAAIAMRDALSEKGFDSFLMVDDFENGLSLGFFSQRRNAVNYIDRLANNGFTAELLEKEKRANVSWLRLQPAQAAEYRRVAATAQQQFGQINLQRNSCESVAF